MLNKYIHKKLFWLLFASILAYSSSNGQHHAVDSGRETPINLYAKKHTSQIGIIKERPVEESLLSKLRNDEAFWYANLKPQRNKPTGKIPFWTDLLQKPWFKSFLWIFISGSFTIVLLWYLTITNVSLFHKTPKRVEDTIENPLTVDIFSLNYPLEIQDAIDNKNFRLGVRLLFLQTLKELAEKSFIDYEIDRTDNDYLMQLSNTAHYKHFSTLTQSFKYVWYGQMPVNASAFERIKIEYEHFQQQLHN